MMALGSRLLGREKDFDTGIRVTNACVWVYESSATGVGPESTTFYANEEKPVKYVNPQLPVGVKHGESRYIGRPETIESVFYMYRTTGDRKWQDKGWRMFVSWVENSIAPAGYVAFLSFVSFASSRMRISFLASAAALHISASAISATYMYRRR